MNANTLGLKARWSRASAFLISFLKAFWMAVQVTAAATGWLICAVVILGCVMLLIVPDTFFVKDFVARMRAPQPNVIVAIRAELLVVGCIGAYFARSCGKWLATWWRTVVWKSEIPTLYAEEG